MQSEPFMTQHLSFMRLLTRDKDMTKKVFAHVMYALKETRVKKRWQECEGGECRSYAASSNDPPLKKGF